MYNLYNNIKKNIAIDEFTHEYLKRNLSIVIYALIIASGILTIVASIGHLLGPYTRYLTSGGFFLFLILLRINRRGYSATSAFLTILVILLIGNAGLYLGRGFRDESMLIFPGVIILSSLILHRNIYLMFSFLTLINVIIIGVAEITGIYNHEVSGFTNPGEIVSAVAILSVTAIIVYLLNTKLVSSAQRVRESEYQFRSFFDSNPDGIIIMDFEGKIQQINRTIIKMFGYDADAVISHHFSEYIPESDSKVLESIILELRSGISTGEPFESEIITRDGVKIPILLRAWLVRDPESNPLALGAFIKDISEKRELLAEKSSLEQQLFHMQKSEAIGTLAGGIAHDFNNILVGILGYTELAMADVKNYHLIQEYLEKIKDAGIRAKELVLQILKFSRREKGELGPVSLGSLVKEVVKLVESTFPAEITIKKTIDAKRDMINGDATQIHQVLMNLCTNAFHAMEGQSGILSIHLDNHPIEKTKNYFNMQIPPGNYVRIRVADNGCGMTPELINRIFEPYFTTKNAEQGTGLGLSVTMGIVQNHNGLIEVNSKPDVGTTFSVYFPELLTKKPKKAVSPSIHHKGDGENVLVVDDEDFFISIMRDYLIHMNYNPTIYRDSMEALVDLRENKSKYSLVITDLSMPNMSGIEFISEINKMKIDIPIILCTGFSEDVTEDTAEYYGITKFLLKPVSKSDIEHAIADIFDKK